MKHEATKERCRRQKDTAASQSPQLKPLHVQSAAWSVHQESDSTATNPKISMCEESAIIIIIIITYPLTVKSLGTTDDFTTSFLHFSLSSTALWDLANSRPVHSLRLSSHLFFCLPCLFPPFTVPCKMVLTRP